ncbi:MAG: short-chain dehydrogenase/reductase [Thermoleophilia bacterium]|nr:short-chain dehydrogenase/reductase [Thermoleophilia bacterium]MCZ4497077.1 short-chain dehydrogenase/reductase [Thermoleophilia bacterium]
MKRLKGRTALVTGAASGIGRATARRLAAEGAIVIISDIQQEAGEAAAAELREEGSTATFVQHDVTSEDGWKQVIDQVVAEHGKLDILVNNAGIGDSLPIEETDMKTWDRTIAVTQTSVFLGMKAAAEALKASGNGSVINISSIFGTSGGFGVSPAYHAAKGAVRLLTKTTALHWATEGVRVNSVHPGFIDTPILDQNRDEASMGAMVGTTPMGRLGKPEEIAAAIAFLASDDAAFVTGSELYVDGGFTAR